MHKLYTVLKENEDWILEKIIYYAKKYDYLQYFDGPERYLRSTIRDLSDLIIEEWTKEIEPDESLQDLDKCPVAIFAIAEAKKHLERGIDPGTFLRLLKYIRRGYFDLVARGNFDLQYERTARYFIALFFDKLELSLTNMWTSESETKILRELKLSNKTVTDQKLKLLTIFESLPIPAILLNKDLTVEDINIAATEIFFDSSEVLTWLKEELLNFSLKTSCQHTFRKILTINKNKLYFEIKFKKVFNLGKDLIGIILMISNITSQKIAEERLMENAQKYKSLFDQLESSERLFKSYFDNSAIGMALTDSLGRYLKVNKSLCNMLGYTEEEFMEADFQKLSHPDELNEALNGFQEMLEGKRNTLTIEKKCLHKNGSTVWTEVTTTIVRDIKGEVLYCCDQIQDITNRKMSEDLLKGSEYKFRTLFNKANDMIALREINEDGMPGRFIEVNDKACRKLGYTREEFLEMNATDIMTEESVNKLRLLTKQYLEKGHLTIELDYLSKDKRKIPFEVNAHIFELDNKKVTLAIVRDISERKTLEQEQFRSSKLESLSLLAGGIAHDFNNFLTVIVGNLYLMKLKVTNENLLTRINEVEKASLGARKLTQQLLDFSKQGQPTKKSTSIGELLREATNFALSGSKSSCEFLISEDLWMVNIDTGQINQVINNLIINADYAMPSEGHITVSAENIVLENSLLPLKAGNYVRISIKDTGTGIPKEILPRIFEPYFTTKESGNGLGLATCYSIITKHDGHISVTSEPDTGTSFDIFLPANG